MNRIALTRKGSHVKRWHTKSILGEQNLGHHSFGVVSLLMLMHPAPTWTLMRAALWHDMAEQVTGDIPSPILREEHEFGVIHDKLEAQFMRENLSVELDHLSEEERNWLWAADKLECLLFSIEQVRLGNRNFRNTMGIVFQWFYGTSDVPGPIMQVVGALYREVRDENEDS